MLHYKSALMQAKSAQSLPRYAPAPLIPFTLQALAARLLSQCCSTFDIFCLVERRLCETAVRKRDERVIFQGLPQESGRGSRRFREAAERNGAAMLPAAISKSFQEDVRQKIQPIH